MDPYHFRFPGADTLLSHFQSHEATAPFFGEESGLSSEVTLAVRGYFQEVTERMANKDALSAEDPYNATPILEACKSRHFTPLTQLDPSSLHTVITRVETAFSSAYRPLLVQLSSEAYKKKREESGISSEAAEAARKQSVKEAEKRTWEFLFNSLMDTCLPVERAPVFIGTREEVEAGRTRYRAKVEAAEKQGLSSLLMVLTKNAAALEETALSAERRALQAGKKAGEEREKAQREMAVLQEKIATRSSSLSGNTDQATRALHCLQEQYGMAERGIARAMATAERESNRARKAREEADLATEQLKAQKLKESASLE